MIACGVAMVITPTAGRRVPAVQRWQVVSAAHRCCVSAWIAITNGGGALDPRLSVLVM